MSLNLSINGTSWAVDRLDGDGKGGISGKNQRGETVVYIAPGHTTWSVTQGPSLVSQLFDLRDRELRLCVIDVVNAFSGKQVVSKKASPSAVLAAVRKLNADHRAKKEAKA